MPKCVTLCTIGGEALALTCMLVTFKLFYMYTCILVTIYILEEQREGQRVGRNEMMVF